MVKTSRVAKPCRQVLAKLLVFMQSYAGRNNSFELNNLDIDSTRRFTWTWTTCTGMRNELNTRAGCSTTVFSHIYGSAGATALDLVLSYLCRKHLNCKMSLAVQLLNLTISHCILHLIMAQVMLLTFQT